MKKVQQGVTLLELMIVVAIVGILSAIAIPMYQSYAIRAQVTEGLNLAASAKIAVEDSYATTPVWPVDNAGAGLNPANQITGKYVTSVTVANGGITITYGYQANNAINGKTIGLRPGLSASRSVVWVCGTANQPAGLQDYNDSSGAASGAPATSMSAQYVPADCRP